MDPNEQDNHLASQDEQQLIDENAVETIARPGKKLKLLREELGLSHARVAESLHMTAHYVKALEKDQYHKLPGPTFVKGYFKSYAKLLKADVIMECYEKHQGVLDTNKQTEAKEIKAKENSDQNVKWMITAAVIIIMVIALSWWFSS